MEKIDKPVWLLDIDGVINADTPDLKIWDEKSWKITDALGTPHGIKERLFTICYSTKVIDFINSMVDSVDIRWHTTWQKDAHNVAEAVGLPTNFPIADAKEFRYVNTRHQSWWKLGAVERVFLQENRRLIWTDDDIEYYYDQITDFKNSEDVLLISPKSSIGLTLSQMEKIRKFVEAPDAKKAIKADPNPTPYSFSTFDLLG